jgi:AcrR family transcriptional regulator
MMSGTARTTGRTPAARAFRASQVIAAVNALASEGGYEAVQMREVARRAQVALATLYRYYPSKEDLIRAAAEAEVESLRVDIIERPPRGTSAGARAASVFIRAFHAMKRNPGFTHAAMTVFHTPRPLMSARPISDTERKSLVDIAAMAAWGANHETSEDEYVVLFAIEAIMNNGVISWLSGRLTADFVERGLSLAGERLISPDLATALSPPCPPHTEASSRRRHVQAI